MGTALAKLKLHQRLSGSAAGMIIAATGAILLWRVAPPPGTLSHKLALVLCEAGAMWGLSALLLPSGRLARAIYWVSVNMLILAGMVGFVEVAGRAGKIDFARFRTQHAEESRNDYPLWTREPEVPLPEAFFRHPGPFSWTGQPLRTLEVLRLGTDNAYVNEQPISIDYDADGFRNPADLKDWDAVVVGDSYTELGYLPDAQMSSFIAAQRTSLRVRNLGVCDTGLLTYSRYLEHFGHAPSVKQVVFVMFEGNDIQDTELEHAALTRFQLYAERDYRELGAQTSFIKAMATVVKDARNKPKPQSYQNAWFRAKDELLPITISTELPINPKTMTGPQLMALKAGISACAHRAKEMNLRASLVYVPVNNRVYHGMLRFADSLPSEVREWTPHDLPRLVSELCAADGIAFADATPTLRAAAEQGRYVHNRILDCHVNAEGAKHIGEVIADVLSSTVMRADVATSPAQNMASP
ncbi:MAG: hypothetical protein JNM99_04970 [Verrucomicrobiaceae bacterium]|nr:hypothetical protein [Verrucomicrobiaceae bacterium]